MPQLTRPSTRRAQPNHPAQRCPMRPSSVRQQAATTKARNRRRTITGLAVLGVGSLALCILAWVIVSVLSRSIQPAPPAASVAPSAAQAAVSAPPVSAPPAAAPLVPAATGALDVAGIPALYNRTHAIPEEHRAALALVDVGGDQQMEAQAAEAFIAMQQAASAESITLTPISGFRTLERQTNNYNNSVQNHIAAGRSNSEAIRLTEQYYAIPGTSEHEMGLAMDIGQVDDSFANTPAYTWLQQHCTEYGFIYRYPKESVATTQINWEPWHYRFIGQNHAAEYTHLGMATLEDYIAHLQPAAA